MCKHEWWQVRPIDYPWLLGVLSVAVCLASRIRRWSSRQRWSQLRRFVGLLATVWFFGASNFTFNSKTWEHILIMVSMSILDIVHIYLELTFIVDSLIVNMIKRHLDLTRGCLRSEFLLACDPLFLGCSLVIHALEGLYCS